MVNSNMSHFDSDSRMRLCKSKKETEQVNFDVVSCKDLFCATLVTLPPNSQIQMDFSGLFNLLVVSSGEVAVGFMADRLVVATGEIWLVEDGEGVMLHNTSQHDAQFIKLEMHQAMLTRFNQRYTGVITARREKNDYVIAFADRGSNRVILDACDITKMSVAALHYYLNLDDMDLYLLKLEELLLLKLKSSKGNYLTFHLLSRSDPAKERYRKFLEENVLQDWSLATYAKEAGMSLTSFKVMFSQVFNDSSPKAWINERRLRHADNLLKTTRLRMIDIAIESGFSSQSYFTQAYKARYGCSPSDVRQKS